MENYTFTLTRPKLQRQTAKTYTKEEISLISKQTKLKYDSIKNKLLLQQEQQQNIIEYQGNKYYISFYNFNVYSFIKPHLLVGIWDDKLRKIYFLQDFDNNH